MTNSEQVDQPQTPNRKVQPAADNGFLRAARALIYILLVSLAFMQPQLPMHGVAIVPTDGIAIVLVILWAALIASGKRQVRWDGLFALVAAYFVIIVISSAIAEDPFSHFTARILGKAYLLGIPVVVVGLIDNGTQLRNACLAWLVGSAIAVLMAVAALTTMIVDPSNTYLELVQHHYGSLPVSPLVRLKLAYENPNMLGAYLSSSFMIALLAGTRGWIGPVTALLLVTGLALTLLTTLSAGIGGAILGGGFWFWVRTRETHPKGAAAVLTLGLAMGTAFALAQVFTPVDYAGARFHLRVPGTDVSLVPSARMRVWMDTIATILAHPETGVGIGNDVAHVWFTEPNGTQHLLRDGHNVLLNVVAESGLLAGVAISTIIFAIWRRSQPGMRTNNSDEMPGAALGIAILIVLAYQGIGGSFEDARFVWAMIGLQLASTRFSRLRGSCG